MDYRQNSILLRADVHRLFDLNSLAVHPEKGKIVAKNGIDSAYPELKNRQVTLPEEGSTLQAFVKRWKIFSAT